MSLLIHITNTVVGEGVLYTEENQQGEEISVPLYCMRIKNESGSSENFDVTRDVIPGKNECPQNKPKVPYLGHIRVDGGKGFRIEMYEKGIDVNNNTLLGIGDEPRTHIQIHIGPGKSEGCFLLTGGEVGRDLFEKAIEKLRKEDIANGFDSELIQIRVHSK